jgi:hypothetical protein
MPRLLIAAALLALAPAAVRAQDDDEFLKARLGKYRVDEKGYYTRLVYDGTLIGSQFNQRNFHRADAPNVLGLGTQWEALALLGVHNRWNPRLEPLTYYHRSGPVGAAFHHLRTRNDGQDATAPVGVCGMFAGTPAAYALRGQSMTFYSVHDEPGELVERTDQYFTFVPDARDRGAKLDFHYGPLRETLAADADRRFALLLVEMIEESYDPGDRLTLEAVKLYLDRTRPDGIVALHTSNKRFNLEPVVERIARELKLSARLWEDGSENRPGMTASSWVVLARSRADLGPLAAPLDDQILAFGARNEPMATLVRNHPSRQPAREAVEEEWGIPTTGPESITPAQVSIRQGPQIGLLYQYIERARQNDDDVTVGRLAEWVHGKMFRPLVADPRVELRTDAHRPGLPLWSSSPPKK